MENKHYFSLHAASSTPSAAIIHKIEASVLLFLRRLSIDETKGNCGSPSFPVSEETVNSKDELNLSSNSSVPELLPLLSQHTIGRTASVCAVLHSVVKLHAENSYSTLREIYYSNTDVASSQRAIDSAVAALTQQLEVPREELRITSSAKCIIRGPIKLQEKTSSGLIESDCGHPLETRGHLISSIGVKKVLHARQDIRFLLIVEKETVFYSLLEQHFIERYGSCILLTGKGFPDINARSTANILNNYFNLQLPVFILTDFDPHGLLVALTYALPSNKRKQFFVEDVSITNAILLCLPSAEEAAAFYGVSLSDMLELSASKRQLLKGISQRIQQAEKTTPNLHPNWRRQLIKLQRTKMTYSLDALKDLPLIIMQAIEEELGCIGSWRLFEKKIKIN